MIKVYQGQHHADAHLVCGLLQAEGIPALVRDEMLATVMEAPMVIPGCLPTVWILDPARLEKALDLVTRFRRDGVPDGGGWTCAGCGEVLEAAFGECWNCGAVRQGPFVQ